VTANGRDDKQGGAMDGTTSSDDIDSVRAKAAWLAANSQPLWAIMQDCNRTYQCRPSHPTGIQSVLMQNNRNRT